MYYGWSKEFLEAGKRRLAGDTARAATAIMLFLSSRPRGEDPSPRRTYDRYQGGGPEALADRPSRRDRVWNRIPEAIRSQIVDRAQALKEVVADLTLENRASDAALCRRHRSADTRTRSRARRLNGLRLMRTGACSPSPAFVPSHGRAETGMVAGSV